ncbi:MAG: bifunctional phosphopantothenoylcysteine decarboxylase/phosphopantothenate--cysteine ligase CoaBC [Bacteroidales bacterium]|nr:bifunctional phosphopantothenoylcysteine decarboxylase/phosphopantothenate--cysteine ligase CoaBC [Bacteroidales bacterium]MDD4575611.1 bifunctional phosphopantothenoylcysteine decarboxylase/phosphopantothenate--cysteine ligase CoaBC [Bacteroidales bacterium]
MPEQKNILIGITGGIAAYKSLFLIRLFVKHHYKVKVVATKNALKFITPLSIETLSNNKLYSDVFASPEEYSTEHISISDWADVLIVAPATANCIGKYAGGIADDALSTTLLAFNKHVFMAPAMNSKMLEHFSVQKNIAYLQNQGVRFIDGTYGDLACGYEGKGRMAEPEIIFQEIDSFLLNDKILKNKKVLITAGPTYEAIDPVRFIGNHSTGKMGFALAQACAEKGADVTLISGPVALETPPNVKRIQVVSTEEMFQACLTHFPSSDITIMAAAVADYKPTDISSIKLKKTNDKMQLNLSKTTDILSTLGNQKTESQCLVGFALETNNEIDNAIKKLHTKKLDFIVLNSLNDDGAGFAFDTNKISIIDKNTQITNFPLKSKKEAAQDILNTIINCIF